MKTSVKIVSRMNLSANVAASVARIRMGNEVSFEVDLCLNGNVSEPLKASKLSDADSLVDAVADWLSGACLETNSNRMDKIAASLAEVGFDVAEYRALLASREATRLANLRARLSA